MPNGHLTSAAFLNKPLRHHETIQKCCGAIDLVNEFEKPGDEPLSLQKSQSLMTSWAECQKGLEDRFDGTASLMTSLTEFREYFFSSMQRGFHDKATNLKVQMMQSITTCLDFSDSTSICSSWNDLREQLDDYMRLSTADVFDSATKDNMSVVSSAVDHLWNLPYHGL